MTRDVDSTGRRQFLKKAAATGALGTGFLASADSAAAVASDAFNIYALDDGWSHYHIETTYGDWFSGEDEDNDETNGDSFTGWVYEGYKDYYYCDCLGAPKITDMEFGGKAEMYYDKQFNDEMAGALDDHVEIEVSGTGDYLLGAWNRGTFQEADGTVEEGEIETWGFGDNVTMDATFTVVYDLEGVVDGEVFDDEVEFLTGQLDGGVDRYEGYASYDIPSPYIFQLSGDISIDITYN